ncbi:GH1 family beta-glucosidase [Feifania hominis]|uniref:Beta-glucosidase n=1 Tax=Feifania hominis TaxID=2763660 RepID=A0A926DE85_9FIRM|nr:GH1 family beta-glucosidase [Feifania hominis]MBC8536596.1 beta-glucosidase [Feifania hominis]
MTNLFPKNFEWGVATSSYQIEGAALEDGRTAGIWDAFCEDHSRIADGSDGAVACDHYHRFREDVALMRELGVTSYRMSFSWPRLFPTDSPEPNEQGVRFYRELFAALHDAGISVMATLYHWDLPVWLARRGGFASRETAQVFADFATRLFSLFGDDVDYWVTINEPSVIASLGYITGEHAPGERDMAKAMAAAHHLLLAHGLAVQRFREAGLRSKIGIVLNLVKYVPDSPRPRDRFARFKLDLFYNEWFLSALGEGRYPPLPAGFLRRAKCHPDVHHGDMEIIAQPVDFVGVNYYTRARVRAAHCPSQMNCVLADDPGDEATDMGWTIDPDGLRDVCKRVYRTLRKPLYITENGAAFDDELTGGAVHDEKRTDYLRRHIEAVEQLLLDWVDVRGYYVWSLLDNFEWAHGYTRRFGITHVNFDTGERTPKDSALWYRDFIRDHRRS